MFKEERELTTFGRKRYNFINPTVDAISIHDIAHSLSLLCRYNGHTPQFYSVAEHSVLVSRILPDDLALVGLLHDATEAYVGDMSRPCKKSLRFINWASNPMTGPPQDDCSSDYDMLESIAWGVICERFGLQQGQYPEAVRDADMVVCANEIAVMGWEDVALSQYFDAPFDRGKIKFLSSECAEELFLDRWRDLYKGR